MNVLGVGARRIMKRSIRSCINIIIRVRSHQFFLSAHMLRLCQPNARADFCVFFRYAIFKLSNGHHWNSMNSPDLPFILHIHYILSCSTIASKHNISLAWSSSSLSFSTQKALITRKICEYASENAQCIELNFCCGFYFSYVSKHNYFFVFFATDSSSLSARRRAPIQNDRMQTKTEKKIRYFIALARKWIDIPIYWYSSMAGIEHALHWALLIVSGVRVRSRIFAASSEWPEFGRRMRRIAQSLCLVLELHRMHLENNDNSLPHHAMLWNSNKVMYGHSFCSI